MSKLGIKARIEAPSKTSLPALVQAAALQSVFAEHALGIKLALAVLTLQQAQRSIKKHWLLRLCQSSKCKLMEVDVGTSLQALVQAAAHVSI